MAFLKEAAKFSSPVYLGYTKYRKGREEDKKKEKFVKDVATGKKGLPETVKDIGKMYGKAGGYADKFYGDIQNRAVTEFNQQTVPSLITQYGQGSKSSSALNQALAAAAGNLQQNIAADFANMKTNLASNIVNQSQYGAAQNLQNQLALHQGPSNTSQFWGKVAPIAGLGIGAMMGNPILGLQAGNAAGQMMQ